LRVAGRLYQTWQEAEEREVRLDGLSLEKLQICPRSSEFRYPSRHSIEPIQNEAGAVVGVLVREQQPIEGQIQLSAAEIRPGAYRVTLRVSCRSPLADAANREEALLRALISTHAILSLRHGEFVSLLDPPESWRDAAASCRNLGVWPVLVGDEGQADTILASPMILYDYPRIAPESPGDLFDGLEIDEILSLRIMTLTDQEKAQMASLDDRARALLARTEALARDQLLNLHGTIRRDPPPRPGGQ
jgi:hydrogenase maturation protease